MKKRLILGSLTVIILLTTLFSVRGEPSIPDTFSIVDDSTAVAPSASTQIDTVTIDLGNGKSTKIQKGGWESYFEVKDNGWKLKAGAYDQKTDTWTAKTSGALDGKQFKYSSDGQSAIDFKENLLRYWFKNNEGEWESKVIDQTSTENFAQATVKNINGKTVVEYADGSASVNAQVILPAIVKQAGGAVGIDFSKEVSGASLSTANGGTINWQTTLSGLSMISQTTPAVEADKSATTITILTLPNGQKLEGTEAVENIAELKGKTLKLGNEEYTISEVDLSGGAGGGSFQLKGKEKTLSIVSNAVLSTITLTEEKGETTTTTQYGIDGFGGVISKKTKVEEDGKVQEETVINYETDKDGKAVKDFKSGQPVVKETGTAVFDGGEKKYTKYTDKKTGAVSYGFEPEGEVKTELDGKKEAAKQGAEAAETALAKQNPQAPTSAQYQQIEQNLLQKQAEVIKKEDEVQKKGEELVVAEAALAQAESAVDRIDASVNQAKENLKKAKAAEKKAGEELAVLGSEMETLQTTFNTADAEKKKKEVLEQRVGAANQALRQAEAAAIEARIHVSDDGEKVCIGECGSESNFVSPEGLSTQTCTIGGTACTQEQVDIFKEKAKFASEERKSEVFWQTAGAIALGQTEVQKTIGSILGFRPGWESLSTWLAPDKTNEWRKWASNTFDSLMLAEYVVPKAVCDYDEAHKTKKLGEYAAFIEVAPGITQSVISFQAERAEAGYILCDEETPCLSNYECKKNLCTKANQPVSGYLYKIFWGVSSPRDEEFTPYLDENGVAVSFNFKLKGASGEIYLYSLDGILNGAVQLKNGASDKEAIAHYSPADFNQFCVEWKQPPEDLSGDEISDDCIDLISTSAGSIIYGEGESAGSTTVSSGQVQKNLNW